MNEKSDQSNEPPVPSSHVTAAPNEMPGHNFDPQIRAQYANEPKVVHAARQPEAANLSVNEDNVRRHNEAVKRYPHLNLSEGEFVVLDVKRHPIGLLMPVFVTTVAILAVIALMILYPSDTSLSTGMLLPSYDVVFWPLMILMLLIGLGGSIAVWVYLQNQFYMTNESVIQEIQHSLFSRHEQTVSLGSIEDASFKQSGILQVMLNYGTVRLSTEGEETTYRFTYVANPRNHVAILNNAIEAFKNGRAVDPYEN
jgi:uncharacterized membrane protein YdbT with pleckstrin-like domain